jgi:diadenosine tetraphosphatase ApaH/serine/threonine PP2A family protein phosphatase
MLILVLSDIHGNYTALDAVLKDAGKVDEIWCLGDLLGYGPDPNDVVKKIRSLKNCSCLLGNHDAAVLGKMDLEAFNRDARLSVEWNQRELKAENLAFIKSLPEKLVMNEATLVHGSPRNPVWEYVLDWQIAMYNFEFFETDFCFIGHTHIPVVFEMTEDESNYHLEILNPTGPVELKPRAIINPGSVGQPRDRDSRAAYALYDTQTRLWYPKRITYDIGSVQERIYKARLPERNAIRLVDGW